MTWRETVKVTKAEHPGLPFKDVLKKASETFRKPPEVLPPPKRRYVRKQPPRAETPAV